MKKFEWHEITPVNFFAETPFLGILTEAACIEMIKINK
jgi:hypothetical protein